MSEPSHLTLNTVVLIGLMVAASCAGNILLKLGAEATASLELHYRLFDWRILLGLSIFAASALLYILVLGKLPLNVAQSMMALQYVAVLFASVTFLGESLPLTRLLGAASVILGVLLIGMSV